MNFLIDMDGVVVDFFGGCCKLFGKDKQRLLENCPPALWDFYHLFDQTEDDFWRIVHNDGSDFWAELEPIPGGIELFRHLDSHAPTTFCSAPSYSPSSLEGKLRWLHRHFGPRFREYVFTKRKHLLATPGAVLVDDSDANVEAFRKAGGRSILVPRPWNKDHRTAAIPGMSECTVYGRIQNLIHGDTSSPDMEGDAVEV